MSNISSLPKANRPSEKEMARGMCIKNARQCRVCGAGADLYNGGYVCQDNPNHMGDRTLGLFSDHSYPNDDRIRVFRFVRK